MTNFIIPSLVLFICFYGLYKKVDIYDEFINGVKEGLSTIIKIFPTIFTMIIAVNVLIGSNVIFDLTKLISPIFTYLKFPPELLSLAILRPISGSSSLVLLQDNLATYNPDSYIGRIASVIQGSTDTTIYIISLYFSSIGIKNIKYSLFVGLLADLSAIILSVILINILFKNLS